MSFKEYKKWLSIVVKCNSLKGLSLPEHKKKNDNETLASTKAIPVLPLPLFLG